MVHSPSGEHSVMLVTDSLGIMVMVNKANKMGYGAGWYIRKT